MGSIETPVLTDVVKPGFEDSENKLVRESAGRYSSSLPFGRQLGLSSIDGPTYVTAQVLVQQVAYSLSDKIFSYSPESFDLDLAIKHWVGEKELNVYGYNTGVQHLQTRVGAGSIALGYIFSKDFDLKKRHIPQGIIASTASLLYLRSSLEQLSLLYSVANPFVAHVAAVDYVGGPAGGLVTDYVNALTTANELDLGLVCSLSSYDSQHMALFSTLLAEVLPTIHIYDGLVVARETVRVVDVMGQRALYDAYKSIKEQISGPSAKHTDAEGRTIDLLKAFNNELGTEYGLFEYKGHATPESVLVVFGTVESSLAAQIAESLSKNNVKIGVVIVRVYRPFVEEEFLRVLPTSTKHIGVLGQVANKNSVSDSCVRSALFDDVMVALSFSDRNIEPGSIQDIKYPREERWTPVSIAAAFQLLAGKAILQTKEQGLLESSLVHQYTFWGLDDESSATAAICVGQALAQDSTKNVSVTNCFDNLIQGGAVRIDIRQSLKTVDVPYSIDHADIAYVGDAKLLKDIDPARSIREGGKLLIRLPDFKNDELEKELPLSFRRALAEKKIELFVLNPHADEEVSNDSELETYLVQVAFLKIAGLEFVGAKLAAVVGSQKLLESMIAKLALSLQEVKIPEAWKTAESESETEPSTLPGNINFNSFSAFEKTEPEEPIVLKDWQNIAKALVFKEAYGTETSLRPDLSVQTFTVRVQENRRLTPLTYERNIFHIEFDLGDTGLKYDIGEALGIHAQNDPNDVDEFIKFYGLNPDDVVEVPTREDPDRVETRTIYQALMQNVDIFGRPPKRFYENLASFATKEEEKNKLLSLAGPEGAMEFKLRAELDTLTYVDILQEFPSAHPGFHDLARIVSPMKRREYSIASCQKVTPKSVALMIVAVSWVDSKGRNRFGQATRYLKGLKPGAEVVVSVKPSVMKLPPKSTQPLIMAGLGTGLAPFRAFVQHRALEKAQGKEIGSILLYMGSRHRREEYCYGEEWEAYRDAGVITLLGQAFSRDQDYKIYIQDRMRESITDITKAYLHEEGAFYLCGPTWPVPDVTDVLEEAIVNEAKKAGKRVDSRKEIEKLKESGRYVLEVY